MDPGPGERERERGRVSVTEKSEDRESTTRGKARGTERRQGRTEGDKCRENGEMGEEDKWQTNISPAKKKREKTRKEREREGLKSKRGNFKSL